MTTNASKFGLRKAASERSKKHAQRTPLPPRPGDVADAKDVLNALAALSNGDGSDPKSLGKAQSFAEKAGALEWEVSIAPVAGAAELTATRGNETIVQAWRDGVWQYDASIYAYGDRTTKPRNASGALKLLNRTPEAAKAETAKVAANRSFRKREPQDIGDRLETAQKILPFDPQTSTDAEIMAAVTGQSIAWYNRLSRGEEAGVVGKGRHLRMTVNESGERVLSFCCPVTGYRSLLVTAILRVGRGTPRSAGESQAAGGFQKVLVDA